MLVTLGLLAAYLLQLAIVVPRHEPWFDEAQAWLLARDSGLWELLSQRLRYEGTPGLWHLLLVVPTRLGLPFATTHVLAAGASVVAAVLLLRYSPLPRWVVGMVLFSFVLGYQYAVVARSYALVAPLLFAVAAYGPRRLAGVWPFAALLALLANVSAHGLVIAGAVAAGHLIDVIRARHELTTRQLAHHAAALGGLALLAAVIVAQLWLPEDHLARSGVATPGGTDLATAMGSIYNRALVDHAAVAWIFTAVSAAWFARRGTLLLWGLPTVGLLLFFALVYVSPWHEGLLLLVWVFALWVSFHGADLSAPLDRVLRAGVLTAAAVVLAVQVGWWAQTWYHDVTQPYSGSPALAAHLAEHDLDEKVVWARGFHALGAQPYFPTNIFDNLQTGPDGAYLSWQDPYPLPASEEAIRRERPDLLVWGVKWPGQEHIPVLDLYEVQAVFPGEIFYKDRVWEQDAFILLRLADP